MHFRPSVYNLSATVVNLNWYNHLSPWDAREECSRGFGVMSFYCSVTLQSLAESCLMLVLSERFWQHARGTEGTEGWGEEEEEEEGMWEGEGGCNSMQFELCVPCTLGQEQNQQAGISKEMPGFANTCRDSLTGTGLMEILAEHGLPRRESSCHAIA